MWLWFTTTALAQAVPWPADTAWRPSTIQGSATIDPTGDQNGLPIYDIVGDSTAPAVYQYVDANWIMIRARLAASPQASTTDWSNFAFFDYQEQDGDRSSGTWDTVIFLDGKTSEVVIGGNTSPNGPDWCQDQIDQRAYTYAAPADFTGNARVVAANTTLGSPGADVSWTSRSRRPTT